MASLATDIAVGDMVDPPVGALDFGSYKLWLSGDPYPQPHIAVKEELGRLKVRDVLFDLFSPGV